MKYAKIMFSGLLIHAMLNTVSFAEEVDKSLRNEYSLNLDKSEKAKDFDEQLMFDKESGRITCFLLYKGSIPIEVKLSHDSYEPSKRVSADICDINSGKYDKILTDPNPNKSNEEGISIWQHSIVPRSVYKIGMAGGGQRYPELDNIYTLKTGEIIGSSCYIWEIPIWKKLGESLKKYNKPFIMSIPSLTPPSRGIKYSKDNLEFEIDLVLYNKMERLKSKIEVAKKAKEEEYGNPEIIRTPIKEVDGEKEFPLIENWPIESQEHSVHFQFDEKTGCFILFFLFNGTIYFERSPKYPGAVSFSERDYKTLDLDKLYCVMNIKTETVAMVSDYTSKKQDYDKEEATFEEAFISYENPSGVESKSTLDRRMTLKNEVYLFGSFCYIWELEIWKTLGEKIKKNKKTYYLWGLGIPDDKLFDIDYSVKIDEALYNKMETLRKSLEDRNSH